MKNKFAFMALLYLFLTVNLTAQSYPAKVSYKDGIKVTKNPDYPKEGKYDLELEELYAIGRDKDLSKYIISYPLGAAMDKNKNLYVLDRQSIIFVFDSKGKYIRQFGQKGSGPGDFKFPFSFGLMKSGKIAMIDGGNHRFCLLDSYGKYLGGSDNTDVMTNLIIDGKDNIYAESKKYDNNKVTENFQFQPVARIINKYDLNLRKWTAIISISGEVYRMMRKGNLTSVRGIENTTFWNISPQEEFYTGSSDKYEISRYSSNGKLLQVFERDCSRIAKRDYKENVDYSRYEPIFTGVSQYDNNGNYWINLTNGKDRQNCIYDVFSSDGIYLKQVFTTYPVELLNGNLAYSYAKGETGSVLIKVFKYSLKKK